MKTIDYFEREIAELLKAECQSKGVDRLTWFCEHIYNYLERWIAFARIDNVPSEAATKTDLFLCVLAAVNLLDRCLAARPLEQQVATSEWSEFKNALEWIKRTHDRDDVKLVEQTFTQFGRVLLAREFSFGEEVAVPLKSPNLDPLR